MHFYKSNAHELNCVRVFALCRHLFDIIIISVGAYEQLLFIV